MGQSLSAIAGPADAEVLHGGPQPGLSWRHLATLVLLALTLPVFATAAVVVLPVLLIVGAAEGLRRLWWLQRSRARG